MGAQDAIPLTPPVWLIGAADQALPLAQQLAARGAALAVVALGDALRDLDGARPDAAIAIELMLAPDAADGGAEAACGAALPIGASLAEVERALILRTLVHCKGNRTAAADMLGISVRTMRNKLRLFLDEGVSVMAASTVTRGGRA